MTALAATFTDTFPPSPRSESPRAFSPILPDPRDWDDVCEELRSLKSLGQDWDGLGAAAPRPDCVESAIAWAESAERVPMAVVPNSVNAAPGGEVVLTWQRPGVYHEVEFAEPGVAEVFLKRDGAPAEQWDERGRIERALPMKDGGWQ